MKRLFITINLLLIFSLIDTGYAQVARDSWSLGFGFSYPRFQSSDLRPQESNYGGYISLQRYFSEHVALRLKGSYLSMEGRIGGNQFFYTDGTIVPTMTEYTRTNVMAGNIDVLYNLSPCSPLSPYIGLGIGVAAFSTDWPENVVNPLDDSDVGGELSFLLGTEWSISDNWDIVTEFSYHTLTGNLDAVNTTNRQGVLGSFNDSYVTINAGFQYYFSKGEPSKYCQLYEGIRVDMPEMDYPTLDEIEDVIKRYSSPPTEIDYDRIEEIIKKNRGTAATADNWKLFGVNFEFGKSTLTPEAYPVLEHAAEMLRENPDIRVEIQGHTDNVGSDSYNQTLSQARANTV
ncbi:MAG: OmpA family protein, partial [Ignavibacteriaceae bacterium]